MTDNLKNELVARGFQAGQHEAFGEVWGKGCVVVVPALDMIFVAGLMQYYSDDSDALAQVDAAAK